MPISRRWSSIPFFTGRRDSIYQAAYLDPHTGAELTLDEIHSLVDDLLEAHAGAERVVSQR